MEHTTLKVKGMSCSHCAQAVNNALEELPGVKNTEVDLGKGEVSFDFEASSITLERIKEAITEAGYSV